MAYRIRDWDLHFENSSSRKLKRLDWVAIPNKTDGEGYVALVDHPNGAAHLGAWLAIVEIASKHNPRGNLPVGSVGGIPQALSRMSRLPAQIFVEVLPRLVQIGWVEEVQSNQQINSTSAESATTLGESADASGESADIAAAHRKGITGKGITGNRHDRPPADLTDNVRRIREKHPKASPRVLIEQLLSVAVSDGRNPVDIEKCHALWCATDSWSKDDGRYAPKLQEWLSDEGYLKWPKRDYDPGDKSQIRPYIPPTAAVS